MTHLEIQNQLPMTKKIYDSNFSNQEYGQQLAFDLCRKHGILEHPERKPEGSSLIFALGEKYFLKITPPFLAESSTAELNALRRVGNQLPFPIPQVIGHGEIANWIYLITETVPGVQAKNVVREMSPENKLLFASEIGGVIKAIHKVDSRGFIRPFGLWKEYLSNQLKDQEAIHLGRGNSPAWTQKICKFVESHSKFFDLLSSAKLIHADLNHEHLLLQKKEGSWRFSGLIDFADSMDAPVELEYILPILCFFKGQQEHQKNLLTSAGFEPRFNIKDYPNIMMALALQNRFLSFEDWFDREIAKGANSVEEVASAIFPAL